MSGTGWIEPCFWSILGCISSVESGLKQAFLLKESPFLAMEILLFDVYSLPERLFANKLPEVTISVSVVGALASAGVS